MKVYFFDSLNGVGDNIIGQYPLLLKGNPTGAYFALKNYNFFSAPENPLLILDFTNDGLLNDFLFQLKGSKETEWLFHYVIQIMQFNLNRAHIHLILVFV